MLPTGHPGDEVGPVPDDRLGSAEIRRAATVMLVRDAASGLEVFMLRRVPQMEFAPRMTVFPGGAVDPQDLDQSIPWRGPDPSWWATELGVNAAAARALLVAAVRELFEETGVLLATGDSDDEIAGPAPDTRSALLNGRLGLTAALAGAGLAVRADLLRPWANWITPPGRTRRYDTFFFAAALPAGQRAEMLTTEADLGVWKSPRALLEERDAQVTALMPPTVAMLVDLAELATVADVLAARRVVTPVRVRAGEFPADLLGRASGI